ncbi:MAG: Flp pilus assembly protein CpaB [Ideonella sp. MAG2]|nr:MAG: Flp pilus assembly protein CpaB [Ideonella sp. MAG2]
MNAPTASPSHKSTQGATRRTWVILVVALVLGGAAAMLSLSYLNRQKAAIAAQANLASGIKVQMMVAKRPLSRGDAISQETVAAREVPVEYSHSLALKAEDFSRVEGKLLAYPIKAGEMILPSLIQGGAATFSARVEPGRRAVTMQVDEISSISGLVEPGDLIDLLLTTNQGGRHAAPVPVLLGVEVMATGQRVANDPRTGESRRYSTVTLNTTPEQARNVISAREMGKITALLRNPKDKPAGAVEEVDVSLLEGGGPAALPRATPRTRPAPPPTPEVQVLYGLGGKSSSQGKVFGAAGDAPPPAAASTAPSNTTGR